MKNRTIQDVETIISILTDDEQQLLKDTIKFGSWGDADYTFLDDNGNLETVMMWGYCTNDARDGGHFSGRIVSQMFRSIYKKMCPKNYNQIGHIISHCRDWWDDGSGDMLFIRSEYVDAFEAWARQ